MNPDTATTVSVRAATEADIDAIASLESESLGIDAWSPALVRDGVLAQLPTVAYLAAVAPDDTLLGYAVVSAAGDDAELQRIAVDPSVRRQRVGARLLVAVRDHADAHGATRLLLEVREDNHAARAFYAAAGFAEFGRRPRYYRDGAGAAILALDLAAQQERMEQ